MIHLDEAEVERRLATIDLPAVMERALRGIATGESGGPRRAVLATPDRRWLAAMPARSGEAIGAKLVVWIPGNAERGLPTHRAVVVLFAETGEPSAWIEGEGLTRHRTAAVSVVATGTIATRPRGVHAILGCGAQGEAHLEAFARAGLVERCVLWSRTRAHAERLAAYCRERGIDADVAADARAAVAGAHVITTCTAAAAPLFAADDVAPGAHINAVGACVPDRREIPGALVGAGAVVVDDLEAAHAESGDMILAVAEGAAAWDGIVALPEVLAGRARPRSAEVSIFISLGLGVEDIAAAAALLAVP